MAGGPAAGWLSILTGGNLSLKGSLLIGSNQDAPGVFSCAASVNGLPAGAVGVGALDAAVAAVGPVDFIAIAIEIDAMHGGSRSQIVQKGYDAAIIHFVEGKQVGGVKIDVLACRIEGKGGYCI